LDKQVEPTMWHKIFTLIVHRTLALVIVLQFITLFSCQAEERETHQVLCWDVIEYSLEYNGEVGNPFTEVEAIGVFTRPGEAGQIKVEGFYDGGIIWKFRFMPRIEGFWQAELMLRHAGNEVAEVRKRFLCEGYHGHGPLLQSRENPYRLQHEDSTPFYSIGIQPCGASKAGLDGPPRSSGRWNSVDMDTYLQAFEGASNLFRIQLGAGTRAGCAREIIVDSLGLYRYNLDACRLLDETFSLLDRHGFSSILIPFQDMSLWQTDTTSFGSNKDVNGWKNIENREAVEPVLHYLKYLVARYAAYVDIWELFNEDVYTPDEWLREIAAYVRSLDPYDHLLTTNYERPLEAWNDIVTAHEYMSIPAWEVEEHLAKEFARLKSFNKPVMYTEFGNKGFLSNRDPVKWRIAVWTSFMNESSMLFWSMGGALLPEAPEGRRGNANAYLGPEAREYFRYHLDFVKGLPIDMRPVFVGYPGRNELNKYALSNGKTTVLYIHHYRGHDSSTNGGIFVWTGPGKYKLDWYDPGTGRIIKSENVETQSNTLIFNSPEITIDMAAKIQQTGK
jgi:Domain of unknown function (DUF5060)